MQHEHGEQSARSTSFEFAGDVVAKGVKIGVGSNLNPINIIVVVENAEI
jgi:hypothetical protein